MPMARVNGIGLHYEVAGDGPAVLLSATAGNPGSVWASQAAALRDEFQVITYDNRSTGDSERVLPAGIGEMAADAVGLLDHLKIARAHVVGWSMGGMVAQELAIRHPQRVVSLVLLATASHATEHLKLLHGLDLAGTSRRAAAYAMLPWLFTPRFFADPRPVDATLDRLTSGSDPGDPAEERARANAINGAIQRFDSRATLGKIAAPTLVLVGAEDVILPPYLSRELADAIPGAQLRILTRGGHGAPFEFPKEVSRELLGWLNRQRVKRG